MSLDAPGVDPAAVVAGQRDLVVVIDDRLTLRWCNPSMFTMLGWACDDVVGRPMSALVHPNDIGIALSGIEHLHNQDEIYRVGLRLLAASGEWIPVSVTGLDHSSDPRIGGLVLSIRKAEQHTKDLGDLQRQTHTDQLTGLANRNSLHDRLRASTFLDWSRADGDEVVTACFIDLDHFKNVNDIHGHQVGDQVLAAAAQRLRGHTVPGDILARNGGDEFVFVFRSSNDGGPAEAARDLRTSLAQPFKLGDNVLHLTASVGLASHSFASLDADRLLLEADIALYAAKEQGRDQVVAFDEALAVAARRKEHQRKVVRYSLERDGLAMHFQPVVDANLRVVGAEALVRCRDVDGTILGPDQFLGSVASSAMAVRLDHQVFAASCAVLQRLDSERPSDQLWIGCNIAPHTLAQGDFADRILDAVNASGTDPSRICLEITETAAFEAGPGSRSALERLHRAGIQIALDDFGTGFSSLSHLLDLPLSTVKIDRSFIARVHENGPRRAITKGAAELAQSLGCQVVAEGVESQHQLTAVRALGIDLFQGWLFAPGVCFEDFVQVVEKFNPTPG